MWSVEHIKNNVHSLCAFFNFHLFLKIVCKAKQKKKSITSEYVSHSSAYTMDVMLYISTVCTMHLCTKCIYDWMCSNPACIPFIQYCIIPNHYMYCVIDANRYTLCITCITVCQRKTTQGNHFVTYKKLNVSIILFLCIFYLWFFQFLMLFLAFSKFLLLLIFVYTLTFHSHFFVWSDILFFLTPKLPVPNQSLYRTIDMGAITIWSQREEKKIVIFASSTTIYINFFHHTIVLFWHYSLIIKLNSKQ